MGRRSKKFKTPSLVVGILGQNVRDLRDQRYARLPHDTARNKALAKDADTTLSQIQRVIAGEVAVGVDLVESLATALRVQPRDLLTPYLAASMEGKPPPDAHMRDSALLQRR
jgi:hypothetical protein